MKSNAVQLIQSEEGFSLTWEDLWVTVYGQSKSKSILQGLTGYARPGHLLAVMATSGCVKSTLLDALAGYYWLRLGIYVVLALSLGIDIGSDKTTIQARGSLLMFVTSFFTFITIGGFPSFVEEMKPIQVFECERLNRDYGVAAFVISKTHSPPFHI
ncbi:ABC transporter G family member 11 [Quillaja saponaria]|uniref:ABC transporter G family member 11 n=1 Tax=Quillaja saponaria TaxID=32244 RepID=A0AAD7PUU7_QUISA|nr:ABC transporter G family member 11 [Quillaja saponaria]